MSFKETLKDILTGSGTVPGSAEDSEMSDQTGKYGEGYPTDVESNDESTYSEGYEEPNLSQD